MQALEKLKPLALLLLRAALGVIFAFHGYPKLFGHTQQFLQNFPKMGFPAYFVYIAGALEFFGGIVLIAGLFTQVAGFLLCAEMAVAIWKVHLPEAGWMAVDNYQLPLALAAGAFLLACLGAGTISLDQLLFHRRGHRPSRPGRY
jgi:putative oxidoreductase